MTSNSIHVDNEILVGHKWRLVLKLSDKRHEAFGADSLEAKHEIDLARGVLVNILKMCRVSFKSNGGGEDWLRIVEEADEIP